MPHYKHIRLHARNKKRSLALPIVLGILFFFIGSAASTLFFSGSAYDLLNQLKSKIDGLQSVANAEPSNVIIHNSETPKLSTFTLFTPATGLLKPTDDSRMNFQLIPGLAVGSSHMSDEKVVYLTFDDGPSVNTQGVLDVLDKYHAKATFFVTGMNRKYFPLIKAAADKGHTIGLHTMSHDYAQLYSSVDAYFQDLEAIGNLVKEQIGYVPCFIRFPGGSSNTISANYTSGIMTQLTQDVVAKGYQYYDWNGDCTDGSGTLSPDQLYDAALNAGGNNIVMLLHDANAKETTVQALSRIIEHYQAQGYVFKGLDRESYAPHHSINN